MATPVVRDMVTLFGFAEPVASLSHLAGGVAALVGGVHLLRRARDPGLRRGLLVFVIGATALFLVSGCYHSLPFDHPLRAPFRLLDHAMVWLGWMGCFTAAMATLSGWDPAYLVLMWTLTLVGVVLELSVLEQLPVWVSPLLYVGAGWAGFPLLVRIGRRGGPWLSCAARLTAGGVIASIGAAMEMSQWPVIIPRVIEAHELLHICVLIGAGMWFHVFYECADGRYVQVDPALAPAPASSPSPAPSTSSSHDDPDDLTVLPA